MYDLLSVTGINGERVTLMIDGTMLVLSIMQKDGTQATARLPESRASELAAVLAAAF